MSEPEAIAVHLEDMDVMREAVEERTGEPLGAEHGRPLVERCPVGAQVNWCRIATRFDRNRRAIKPYQFRLLETETGRRPQCLSKAPFRRLHGSTVL